MQPFSCWFLFSLLIYFLLLIILFYFLFNLSLIINKFFIFILSIFTSIWFLVYFWTVYLFTSFLLYCCLCHYDYVCLRASIFIFLEFSVQYIYSTKFLESIYIFWFIYWNIQLLVNLLILYLTENNAFNMKMRRLILIHIIHIYWCVHEFG